MTTADGVVRDAGEVATPAICGSVDSCQLAAERDLLISVVELTSRPGSSLFQLADFVCTRLALTFHFDRAFVLLVDRAGEVTNGPATLTLAGRYPSTAHVPMATETRAAHRVLSSGIAEASCSDTTSWLIAAPLRSSSGVLGVMVAASSNRKGLQRGARGSGAGHKPSISSSY